MGVAALIGFVAVTLGVFTGLTDHIDHTIAALARPGDTWGPGQIRAAVVVTLFQPSVVLWVPLVISLSLSVMHRSLRPLLLAGAVGAVTALVVTLLKVWIGRPDVHAGVSHGGSYPSGHTASLIVCCGLLIMLLRPGRASRLWAAVAAPGAVMGAALVLEGAHWTTDVVGGGLLAVAVLAVATALGADRWAAGPTRGRERAPRGATGGVGQTVNQAVRTPPLPATGRTSRPAPGA